MKLYLTSYRIPVIAVLQDLVGKPAGKTRLALIPNAKDYYGPRARAVKIRLVRQALEQYGFTVQLVDLADFHHAPAQIKTALEGFDMLWIMGGNTFCLREAMWRSGFDKIAADLAETMVFAGESAGACIAGMHLHGVEALDDPEFAEKVLWDGLKLVPHYFMPHADNPDFGGIVQRVIAEHADDPAMVVLNDNQAWVVNGDESWKITGSKPAEIINA